MPKWWVCGKAQGVFGALLKGISAVTRRWTGEHAPFQPPVHIQYRTVRAGQVLTDWATTAPGLCVNLLVCLHIYKRGYARIEIELHNSPLTFVNSSATLMDP